MRLWIDTERCTGHGRCYDLAPELFEADDEGYGQQISDDDVPSEKLGLSQNVVASCPEQAIFLK